MSTAAPTTRTAPAPPKRPSRALLWFAVIGAILLLLALGLRTALQPERVTRLILDRAGRALGLEITAAGIGEYRLRGRPTLVVRDVIARAPGATEPVLRAKRIYLSLPWSTLRARGRDLTVDRVELDAPVLHLQALQDWLDSRPRTESRIPTITHGVHVTDGTLLAGSWQLQDLRFDIPVLRAGQRLQLRPLRGRYVAGATVARFDLAATLSEPAKHTALGVAGATTIERRPAEGTPWRMPADVVLGGMLHLQDGWRIEGARLSMAARYLATDTDQPFQLGLYGPLRYRSGRLSVIPMAVSVRGEGLIPSFDAHGGVASSRLLELQLKGVLPQWLEVWPELPPPLDESRSPLPFELDYRGRTDLSDIAHLKLQRDRTRFDGRFRLPEVRQWLDTMRTRSPLPPMDGTIRTPLLRIAGAELHGVELELDDPGIAVDDAR
ncbi:MAG TPA: hypothetical protein VNI56_05505 [Xanthomonadaceae bacterium]|nr:hypothetical protein [Xanthomonadaceae bacterium]